MQADVPMGVFLSGGIDSSAIAGMIVYLTKQGFNAGNDNSRDVSKLKCYTTQFDKNSGEDESGKLA